MNVLFWNVADAVASWFQRFLITITLPFYELAETLFKIFFALARGRVVSPEKYQLVLNNFYIIIGVVMLFVTSFTLLKMLVNPDDQKNGTAVIKKMIINFITSVAIIVLLPTIFGFMFDIQSSVLDYNLIGNIFGLGTANKDECKIGGCPASEAEQQAMVVVNAIYLAFFNIEPSRTVMEIPQDAEGVEIDQSCYSSMKHLEVCQAEILDNAHNEYGKTFRDYIKEVNESGNIGLYTNLSDAVANNHIKLSFFLSLVAGCILVYVVFSYCFDMALRLIKLVFYQMIAPIPVLLRIIPEGKASGAFSQWVKLVLSCYFEVYVRLLVIYFVLWLCKDIDTFISPLTDQLNCSPLASLMAKAFIFLGLIMFMKQAPKLIGDITGIDTGNMQLGLKDKLAASGIFTAGAIVGGGITAGVRNAVAAKQAGKGFWKGAGSTIAGMTSGAFNAGRKGIGAKSFNDMSSSASYGAKMATTNRANRIDRNLRYKANKETWAQGTIGGHIKDFRDGVIDFATGGVSQYEPIIEAGEKFDKQWSAVKSVSGDVKKKKLSDSTTFFKEHISRNVNDSYFKGDNAADVKKLFEELVTTGRVGNLRELEEYYTSLNNRQIDSSSFVTYDENAYEAAKRLAASGINKENYRTGVLDSNGNVLYNEKAYQKAIADAQAAVNKNQFSNGVDQKAYEAAQQELSKERALLASMMAQIDKKSTEAVIDLSRDAALGYDLGLTDVQDIQAEKDKFEEMFRAAGSYVQHEDMEQNAETGKFEKVQKDIKSVSTASDMKKAAEAYQLRAKEAAGEAQRLAQQKAARNNEKK